MMDILRQKLVKRRSMWAWRNQRLKTSPNAARLGIDQAGHMRDAGNRVCSKSRVAAIKVSSQIQGDQVR